MECQTDQERVPDACMVAVKHGVVVVLKEREKDFEVNLMPKLVEDQIVKAYSRYWKMNILGIRYFEKVQKNLVQSVDVLESELDLQETMAVDIVESDLA